MEKLNSILFYNIEKAIKSYRIFAQQQLIKNGFTITIDQWLVMKAISENPEMQQNEIAPFVFKDKASITRIVELLEKSGYLIKEPHKKDRRKLHLKVTQLGKQILIDVQSLIEKNRNHALENVSPEEIETMNTALIQIAKNCITLKI